MEQKLLWTIGQPIGSPKSYSLWEIDWYQNEWPWPLFRGRIKVMSLSTIALHSTLEIDAWFQRTTNRKWHMGYQMVTWPMTSRDPKCAVRQYSRLS